MKRRVLVIACILLPVLPLWFVLVQLAEKKYPVVSAKEYWESRFEERPEFFHLDGFVWFAPPAIYIHGYWPRRVHESEIEQAFLPAWNRFISGLVANTNQWGTNVVQKLHAFTGMDLGERQADWLKWSDENAVTREHAISLLPPPKKADVELEDYFHFHVRYRRWLAAFESALFCLLWTLPVLLAGAVQLTIPETASKTRDEPGARMRSLNYRHSVKWGLIAFLSAIVAFVPWLFGYGAGAFTTWQGPGFLSYSGGYLLHGGFSYGNSIAYRTFVEVFGSPPLWVLHLLPFRQILGGELTIFFFFCVFYMLFGAVLAWALRQLCVALRRYHS